MNLRNSRRFLEPFSPLEIYVAFISLHEVLFDVNLDASITAVERWSRTDRLSQAFVVSPHRLNLQHTSNRERQGPLVGGTQSLGPG